jgi:hypothetical protein
MEAVSAWSTGPRSSMGLPSTSMMRPSVALPTGTVMGLPVLLTMTPRFRPSDEPSAMVRTTPSPSCCCTSRVSADALELERVIHAGHLRRAGIPRRPPRRCTERSCLVPFVDPSNSIRNVLRSRPAGLSR